ncbi:hypothetical protein [Rubellicoccus peritrichatus]|uniref:Uncharacterized protein n=1 Tax=Rubellicoccus peritrichatus TaxID=3080537 RepID=A0AAQ3LDX3_9BACT|nr:hypothetical protein [Puniceicoccus sp. CR14]WOO42817.1 hypothetical protein RZN69_06910 [Puniceicoccus sp. CR14]
MVSQKGRLPARWQSLFEGMMMLAMDESKKDGGIGGCHPAF